MKIRILFFVKNDNKFYKDQLSSFLSDNRFDCKSILFLRKNETSKLNETNNLEVIKTTSQLKRRLAKEDYDVIYFFSIHVLWWRLFRYIPKDRIIIWWTWGYDLYNDQNSRLSPLIKIPLYKKLTKAYLKRESSKPLQLMKDIIKKLTGHLYYEKIRNNGIKRVSYIQPVLSSEFELIKQIKNCKAKLFYSPVDVEQLRAESPREMSSTGSVIIGNSSSQTNNHLDVWNDIKDDLPDNREVIMPLSYGDKKYAQFLKRNIFSNKIRLTFLDSFIPIDEYNEMIGKCSYAVYGIIRQQAIGNIEVALSKGVKCFFYKDSIVYKHLINNGYCVYSIEDINKSSFTTPLTKVEIDKNIKAYFREYSSRSEVLEEAIEEMFTIISNKSRLSS